jgi:hypothetical protein
MLRAIAPDCLPLGQECAIGKPIEAWLANEIAINLDFYFLLALMPKWVPSNLCAVPSAYNHANMQKLQIVINLIAEIVNKNSWLLTYEKVASFLANLVNVAHSSNKKLY